MLVGLPFDRLRERRGLRERNGAEGTEWKLREREPHRERKAPLVEPVETETRG